MQGSKRLKCFVTLKNSYFSREAAQHSADYEQKKNVEKIRVYLCEFCQKWHLTHRKAYKMK